uniref:Protein kinase domain-containing protein n=1 Tax=Panagrolaimus davidi TaxID=227884 RepID=A0A914P363_9BILA
MFESQHDDRTCYGLVFEFLPSTLYTYIRDLRKVFKREPNIIETKLLTWQLFRGQAHLTNQKIIHRDIKPQNILVNPDTGLLKIGDFGSSKFFHAGEISHSYHVTRYYRAPELILKANLYGPEIDVWSCGCVLGEMLKCTVMWVGKTTENQLQLIAGTLGEPTENEIIAMKGRDLSMLSTSEIQEFYDRSSRSPLYNFQKLLPRAPADSIKLMTKILQYTPSERLCGPKLLSNSWFKEIFDPSTRRYNGKPIRILSMEDYRNAIAGDKEEGGTSATGTNTKENEGDDL